MSNTNIREALGSGSLTGLRSLVKPRYVPYIFIYNSIHLIYIHIHVLEVWGPVGPRILVGGPSGLLDIVLRALRALRPCDPRNAALDSGQPTQPKNLKLRRIRFWTFWIVGEILDFYFISLRLFLDCTVAWITRPERPKGVKDEVKQARRAQSRPVGP